MAISQKLQIKQGQSLVITPQLQQAIKLLQLSNIDLSNFIEDAVERNPLLELSSDENNKADKENGELNGFADDNFAKSDENIDSDYQSIKMEDEFSKPASDSIDSSVEDMYPDARSDSINNNKLEWGNSGLGSSTASSSADDYNLEAFVSEKENLRSILGDQLSIANLNSSEKLIGSYLIDQVNDDGYLKVELENVAEVIGADIAVVNKVLQVLKGFEPVGVMTSNLVDCLKIQLKEKDHLDPIMDKLLDNLDLLAKSDFEKLMKILKVDGEDLADMVDEIKSLNPKPGAQYSDGNIETIIADVFVKEAPDGGWSIELNNETLPKILVNQKYYTEVCDNSRKSEEKEFISDCLTEANWLVKSLDQRAKTILKVTKEIVKQQDSFFTYGVQFLKPLTLKYVAEQIEMHESTVSRVTNNKYVSTPRGIFELKYFFTNSVGDNDDDVSASSIKYRLKELVDNEDPKKILSDDKIVQQFKNEGIKIARRTVAKYREALGIPSSVERRRMKKKIMVNNA